MNVIFDAPELTGFTLQEGAGGPLYRKELVYEGTFYDSDNVAHDITDKLLDHWVASFQKMKEAGIEVPVPATHTEDPDKKRGKLVGLEKGVREDGTNTLFGLIEFNDEETAKQSRNNDVSIFVPEERKANGVEEPLKYVIAHVALTDYPVVNDLEGFEAIAASFLCPQKKEKPMLKKLATELGIEFEEDTTDEVVFAKLLSHHNTLTAAIEDMKKKMPKEGDDDDEDDEEKDEEKKKMAASFAKKLAETEGKTRTAQIDGLVSEGKISKPVADDLKKNFCGEGLSLSFSAKKMEFTDSFDATIGALSKNDKVFSTKERTGAQAGNSDEVPAVVRDAEQRAKQAS